MRNLAVVLFFAGLLLLSAEGITPEITITVRLCGVALMAIAAVILRIEDDDK